MDILFFFLQAILAVGSFIIMHQNIITHPTCINLHFIPCFIAHAQMSLWSIMEIEEKLDVHRTHTPRCEVKKIIALWRMHAVMQGWKEVGCED